MLDKDEFFSRPITPQVSNITSAVAQDTADLDCCLWVMQDISVQGTLSCVCLCVDVPLVLGILLFWGIQHTEWVGAEKQVSKP